MSFAARPIGLVASAPPPTTWTFSVYGFGPATQAELADGSFSTGSATFSAGSWIQADFGALVLLTKVHWGTYSGVNSPNGYDLQTSMDGVTWTAQFTTSGATISPALITTSLPSPVVCRYARMINGPSISGFGELYFS